jgi:hypothetical protein
VRISELIWVRWQAKFLKFRKLTATLCCGMARQMGLSGQAHETSGGALIGALWSLIVYKTQKFKVVGRRPL